MKRSEGTYPLWYKDAIFYEMRVRSFYDSDGDGIGDFRGLTTKLDYLQSLGVNAIWLLPFYPSPLRDDGYDISSYTEIHAECGTLADFKTFLREAHRRNLRVVTELVLNHTSERHAWFQRARRAPSGSDERNFYVWSDTPERYKDARVIFQDFEFSNWSWDPIAKAYYFHRFYAHQPDLNYDSPTVRKEILRVVDFWFGLGVDGLRLDAVPYLYKREGTNCENLTETHEFLRELRSYIDSRFSNRMLLAEANQWPEHAVTYLAEGKECHMAFHFPLMPRLFMAIRMEDRFPLTDIWAQTPPIDPTCQWALFLRNHDELTLEMVTDEERDYMYRAYAQDARMRLNLGIRRRLAPLLGNNRRAIELINGLLFSLPGTPVIYYGDEIGMGDNVYLGDRDGVRTPMQWSADRNAGFSNANSQQLILPIVIDPEYHYQAINVEAQEGNRHSSLWWMRRLIALRRQFKVFGRGTIEFLTPDNARVLAYVRRFEDEILLVVANLSRFVQYVELDLSSFKGMTPVELFGNSNFPAIGDLPYLLTLGPHGFVWFALRRPRDQVSVELGEYHPPLIEVGVRGERLLRAPARDALKRALPDYLPRCRWFRSKARSIRIVDIEQLIPFEDATYLAFLKIEYLNAEAEAYVLPLAVAFDEKANEIRSRWQEFVIADAGVAANNSGVKAAGVLYDASVNPGFGREMLSMIRRGRGMRSGSGEVTANRESQADAIEDDATRLEPRLLKAEQSNTSIVFGDKFIMKLFRKLEFGVNPDIEIGRFLSNHAHYPNTPSLTGWLEYRSGRTEPRSLAIVQTFIPNQGDAWQYVLRGLENYFEQAATKAIACEPPQETLVQLLDHDKPDQIAVELIGAYLDSARLMGRRVAELHRALLSNSDDPNFAPEPFSALYQRSVYQSMRNLLGRVIRVMNGRMKAFTPELRKAAGEIASRQDEIAESFEIFLKRPVSVVRMRCHGDLHLGQMLFTGKDFVIIDFEGEPARALAERRRKRAALRDVAGMLRSFQYAALSQMTSEFARGRLGNADFATMDLWVRFWETWCSWAFMRGYVDAASGAPCLPSDREELRQLLDAFTMEKALYELGYELDNRPEWVFLPLNGIARSLGMAPVSPDLSALAARG